MNFFLDRDQGMIGSQMRGASGWKRVPQQNSLKQPSLAPHREE